MVISVQTKGYLEVGGDAEMQAKISDFCSCDLSDAWWYKMFCFQVWF